MSFFASANGYQIVSGTLMIPLVGIWTADVGIATDSAITGPVTIVLGNLTLQGSVVRADAFAGQTRARIVAGGGGWRNPVDQQAYGSPGGVRLSTVLSDVASACGEKVFIGSDRSIGNAWVRTNNQASDVIWAMIAGGFIPAWYIDPSGTTQIVSWPTTTVQSPFTVIDQIPDDGLVEIATEDYASWLPGCTFSAPTLDATFTNCGVTYRFDADGQFRLDVMTDTTSDRLLGPLQQFISAQVNPTLYFGRYRYTVHAPTFTTVDATPVNPAIGLPDLQNVPIDADAISSYLPTAGTECHIMFLDGIPTQPVCVWTAATATHANMLGGTTPAAKLGDTVQSVISGIVTVLGGTVAIAASPPVTGVITGKMLLQGLTPISGTITTGSGKVGMPV
jgi:hypothetical protein